MPHRPDERVRRRLAVLDPDEIQYRERERSLVLIHHRRQCRTSPRHSRRMPGARPEATQGGLSAGVIGGGGPPRPEAGRQLAGGVEVAERLRVRLEQGGLAVRHVARGAERGDQRLRPAQAGPRHRGEQVVLDLVVQAAEGEVGQPAAVDVARGQHLTAQEVGLVVRGQDRHPLVVGRERRSPGRSRTGPAG